MERKSLAEILEAVAAGELAAVDAARAIGALRLRQLGESALDLERVARRGRPEAIFAAGKSPEQLLEIGDAMLAAGQNLLMTRLSSEAAAALFAARPRWAEFYHRRARLLRMQVAPPTARTGFVSVLCAGTSDLAVAEEAALTAEFYGSTVRTAFDVGVAGIHRLFAQGELLRDSRVIVCVAGMEGALPSVVAGLTAAPVIAVPTSVGYGASFNGLSALLTMLNSCAPGVSVVNIDNGFGAGYLADVLNALGEPAALPAERQERWTSRG